MPIQSTIATRVRTAARRAGALLGGLALSALAAHAQGAVSGTVRDAGGAAIFGAEVVASGTAARARSVEGGRFRLTGLPAGDVRLIVRRLGFRPAAHDVRVSEGGPAEVEIELSAVARSLPAVAIRERREVFDARLAGFYARQQRRTGGHFVGRERIERAASLRFTDLLREVPGVQIRPVRNGPSRGVRLRGASCAPLVFVDGFPAAAGEFDLDMLDPKGIEGVEVYGGMSGVPAELLGTRGQEQCGVIAVWSQPSRARTRRPASPRGVVDVAALLDSSLVYTAEQVDDAARLIAGTGVPTYPDSLWRAKVAGRVLSEFVVDTAGQVEAATVDVVSSTHPAFGDAVRAALADARFVPGRLDGRAVRQVVRLPHAFAPPEAPARPAGRDGGDAARPSAAPPAH
jgi:TonB family protein